MSIFILRNNGIGDLLTTTPLFEALSRGFPGARIIAGVGQWNREVLDHNPFVSEILELKAPWHNLVCRSSPFGIARYLLFSPEVKRLRQRQFDVGIDVLGSPWGSLLMMRAGIPYRLGVRGYAGGHTGVQQFLEYNSTEHVGRFALRFAERLGITVFPSYRPQIYLTPQETALAEASWPRRGSGRLRLVLAPGGGFAAKCWPLSCYSELAARLAADPRLCVRIVGGPREAEAGCQLAQTHPALDNQAGKLKLRMVFAQVATADLVICNSSMAMHVAAAFAKPAVVLLGHYFDSASQHMAQWGYPGLSHILGKEAQYAALATVDEAMAVIYRLLAADGHR